MPPTVSIIIATYNRSGVLKLAIESVRRNTFQDWEIIVVGDACTDDTAAVVASFQDPRMEFINLPENCGEQSGPNNAGAQRARGRYIAYLNHDDLWLPEHLELLLGELRSESADLVYGLGLQWTPEGRYRVWSASPNGVYEPQIAVAATLWLFRRELLAEIGPWCSFRETYAVPSQEWLFRVWRADKKVRAAPRITALLLPSGSRPGCYAQGQSAEHQAVCERLMREPGFLTQLLSQALVQYAGERHQLSLGPPLRQLAYRLMSRFCLACGWSPHAGVGFFRFRRKGAKIRRLRQIRGLPPLQ